MNSSKSAPGFGFKPQRETPGLEAQQTERANNNEYIQQIITF